MKKSDDLFYFVDGEKLPLTRQDSVRFVSPVKNEHPAAVGARLAKSSRLSLDPRVASEFLVVRGDAEKLEEIRNYRDIQSTRSAFVNAHGMEMVLTDKITVRFDEGVTDVERKQICKKYPCTIVDDTSDTWVLKVDESGDDEPLAIANALYGESKVKYAEPDALAAPRYHGVPVPSDSYFKNQWHLQNTGQGGGKRGADVNAVGAWTITQGDSSVRVVVHDSGVDIDHVDLVANIGNGWDFDNNDPDASNDLGPHGTACAGVIAAVRNEKGVVGVAPKCRIVPLRAAGAHPFSTWAKTFKWATENGDVISCSWSISANNQLSEAIREAAKHGRDGKGTPIFFATGNEFSPFIAYPSSMKEVISVGASTNQDVRSAYSNYGTGIDFVAPSSGGTLRVETTDVMGPHGYNEKSQGHYCKASDSSGFGGTSSATPLAAGIAALMLSANPELTVDELRKIMQESCVKIDKANANYNAAGWSKEYGYGRLDAEKAVRTAKNSCKEKA